MRTTTAAVLSLAALAAATAPANASGSLFTWKCNFPGFDTMTLVYDHDKKTSSIDGGLGTFPAEVKFGTDAITFMQLLDNGSVRALSLPVGGVTVPAVISHHTFVGDKFTATQAKGICEKQ